MQSTPYVRYTENNTAAIVQWQNAALWQRMSWVRNPLAAPIPPIPLQQESRMLSNQFWYGFALGDGLSLAVLALAFGIYIVRRRHFERTQ